MKTPKIAVIILSTCGLAGLQVSCRCTPKPDLNDGIPLITHQPEDTEVSTNQDTTLTVDIKREASYRFAWFRPMPLVADTNCPSIPFDNTLTLEIQTNRPGWNTSALQIENASTNDEGNYFCLILHETGKNSEEVETRTRWAYLKVYQAPSPHGFGTNLIVTAQVASRQLAGGPQSPSQFCDFSAYNRIWTFKKDDSAKYFTSLPTPSTGKLSVKKNGVPLSYLDFTVMCKEVDVTGSSPYETGVSYCATQFDNTHRKFSAPVKTNYWFQLCLENAPNSPASYELTVEFK